jgi:hypothetical protein
VSFTPVRAELGLVSWATARRTAIERLQEQASRQLEALEQLIPILSKFAVDRRGEIGVDELLALAGKDRDRVLELLKAAGMEVS